MRRMGPGEDVFSEASSDAKRLVSLLGEGFDLGLSVGSGWSRCLVALGAPVAGVELDELGSFVSPGVEGHRSRLELHEISGKRVLALHGRVHLYEGRSPAEVVHPVRVAVMAGCSTLIMTNAAGALGDSFGVGSLAVISDQINLTGASPAAGGDAAGFPPYVDMVDAYSPRLRHIALRCEETAGEGVYAAVAGPNLETPAEVRMLAAMGADLVGMSTALEVIAARQMGAEVLGISLVTNRAVSESSAPGEPLMREAFGMDGLLGVAERAASAAASLIRKVVSNQASDEPPAP